MQKFIRFFEKLLQKLLTTHEYRKSRRNYSETVIFFAKPVDISDLL